MQKRIAKHLIFLFIYPQVPNFVIMQDTMSEVR